VKHLKPADSLKRIREMQNGWLLLGFGPRDCDNIKPDSLAEKATTG